eukprot:gene12158-biopygen3414
MHLPGSGVGDLVNSSGFWAPVVGRRMWIAALSRRPWPAAAESFFGKTWSKTLWETAAPRKLQQSVDFCCGVWGTWRQKFWCTQARSFGAPRPEVLVYRNCERGRSELPFDHPFRRPPVALRKLRPLLFWALLATHGFPPRGPPHPGDCERFSS